MLLRTNRPRSLTLSARRLAVSATVLSLLAGSLLVAPPLLSLRPAAEGRSVRNTTSAGRTHMRWAEDGRTLELWIRGEVSFNEDHTDVD